MAGIDRHAGSPRVRQRVVEQEERWRGHRPVPKMADMRIVTYNIQYGRGKDGRFALDRIAEEAGGADLIALQEVERNWSRSVGAGQPRLIARHFHDHHRAYGPGVDLHLAGGVSGEYRTERRRQFGNTLFSRAPLLTGMSPPACAARKSRSAHEPAAIDSRGRYLAPTIGWSGSNSICSARISPMHRCRHGFDGVRRRIRWSSTAHPVEMA